MDADLTRRFAAEALGSFFLFAAVVGSGIMGEMLAGGNTAVALLANSIATGAILAVLIAMLGPVSGAHFNPAVTLAFLIRREIGLPETAGFVLMQIGGGILGVWAAHFMFDLPVWQLSEKMRTGSGQWLGEGIATFGLVLTILATIRAARPWVPASVALYITSAYWFTSSTSFANPAITIGRSLTNSFAGIAPADVLAFVAAQLAGAVLATLLCAWLLPASDKTAN